MPFIVSYLLKLSISLIAVWCVYWFFLRHLTFYTWNRYFLLIYSLMSFVIPFIDVASLLQRHDMNDTVIMTSIPTLFGAGSVPVNSTNGTNFWVAGLLILAAGIVLMCVRLAIQYISLLRIRKTATLLHSDGLKLYHVNERIMPFSFGDSIYVNQHLHHEEELREIIRHEFIHVKQKHSVDIVFGELLCMLNWYNPFAWMIRNAIRQNLEFIADSAVLSNGMDKKAYQYLLLKVTGVSQFSIANNFNFSSLKKRIAMMNKKQSAKVNLIRFLFMLPVISIVVLAFRGEGDRRDSQQRSSEMNTTITDTIPAPPKPPGPPVPAPLSDGVYSININNKTATIKLENGKVEIYDLNTPADKAKFESKYGKMIEAPVAPTHAVTAVIATGRPVPAQVVHSGISKDYRDFLRRNDNVENVHWMNNPVRIVITLVNGTKEVYNTENADEVRKAEARYGKLPAPPPPPPLPPVPPAPPRPATSVKQTTGSALIVDVTDEPVVVQGYRAKAVEAVTTTGQVVTSDPVISDRYLALAGRAAQTEADREVTGNVVANEYDLQIIAKFTADSKQEDINKVIADLQQQGYQLKVEQIVFRDGKLVRLAATINKGNDKSSFDAADFNTLFISLQMVKGKTGINVHINSRKVPA